MQQSLTEASSSRSTQVNLPILDVNSAVDMQNTDASSSFGSVAYQMFKGVAALCGLATLGGMAYWFSSWFGASRNSDAGVASDNVDTAGGGINRNSIKSIQVADQGQGLRGVLARSQNIVPEASASDIQSGVEVAVEELDSETDAENVFSSDDLEYRDKSALAEPDTSFSSRKLLSTSGGSAGYRYLPSVELSDIGNGWGFKINGEAANDNTGFSVSAAGDVNGDGIDDFIIGRQGNGFNYLVFGKNTSWASTLELSSLNGINGVKLNGGGKSVSAAGDFNADSIDDFIIGSYGGTTSYIVFGKNSSWASPLELSSLNGINGVKLNGAGYSVSAAGDVNGDGIDDIITGYPYYSSYTGVSYVLFGKKSIWNSPINLPNLNGTNGFSINGEVAGDNSGYSISGKGDINADGIDDVIIRAPSGASDSAKSYVVFGRKTIWPASFNLSALNGTNGFKVSCSSDIIATVGDINNDGITDLAIGGYVIFGKNTTWSGSFNLFSVSGMDGFSVTGIGPSVSSVSGGDINADGIDDLVIGERGANSYKGKTYVIFGKKTAWDSTFNILNLNGLNGFTINGEVISDNSGCSVGLAGDINNDGIADLIIGAYSASPYGRTNAGSSYVIFGGYGNLALVNNTLSIYQEHTAIINNATLAANNPGSTINFKISNNQYGYFSLVTQSSIPVYSFTAGQIAASVIQFNHDGSANAPSYQVIVNNGLVETTVPQNATVHFAAPPVLNSNYLMLNQGQTVVVTNATLSAAALGSDPNNLLFQVSFVQHGRFALIPNLATEVTSFIQGFIANNSVVFIHDNTQIKPSYKIVVTDGITPVGPVDAIVNFNAMPVLSSNNFVIGQGQKIIITSATLAATDDHTAADNLKFSMVNAQHGNFTFSGSASNPIYNFFQEQIAGQNISFIHDGSENAPSFQITVSDGILTTVPIAAGVYFDLAPVLSKNVLTIGQGQRVALSGNILAATDKDTDQSTLTFIPTSVKHGKFDSVFNPGVALEQFTQGQISNNLIRFTHDNNLTTPSYLISVSDSLITTNPQNATVIFDLAPHLVNNNLVVGQGQEVVLTNSMLSASDPDNDPLGLTFIISNLKNGRFTLDSESSKVKTQFTQAEVADRQIKFIHDGTVVMPSYQVSVSDNVVTTDPLSAQITFYRAPVLMAHTLTLYQGQTVFINNNILSAISYTNSSAIRFMATVVQHGKFSQVATPDIALSYFTQQQIENNLIQFSHDNSKIAPTAYVSVADEFVTTSPEAFLVNFDVAPLLLTNELSIHQGEKIVLSGSMLSATDIDTPATELIFTISDVNHGKFIFGSTDNPVFIFRQDEVVAGNISFVHDNGNIAPAYKVAVNDSIVTTKCKRAAITFIPYTTETNSTGTIVGLSVSGAIGLGLFLFKKLVDAKTNKIFAGSDLQNRVCQELLKLIKFSGCMGYMSSNTINELRSAVMTLLKKLVEIGVDLNFNKMEPKEQQFLVETIAEQTAKVLLPKRNCCGKISAFFKSYCVAEAIPELIEAHSDKILPVVKDMLENAAANRDIDKMLKSGEFKNIKNLTPRGTPRNTPRGDNKAKVKTTSEQLFNLLRTVNEISKVNQEVRDLMQNKPEEQKQIELTTKV